MKTRWRGIIRFEAKNLMKRGSGEGDRQTEKTVVRKLVSTKKKGQKVIDSGR